jgi:hypothetical protein
MKNTFQIVGGVVFVLALLLFLGVMQGAATVSAQGPVVRPTPAQAPPLAAANPDDPAKAVKFGSAIQAIAPSGVQWYQFDYTTQGVTFPRPDVTVALLNGVSNGLQFEVYSPEDMQAGWFNQAPVGRGTPFVIVDCTNSSDNTGHCTSNDLTWRGGFGLDGTIFVRVLNFSNSTVAPQLIVAGPGEAACQSPTQPAMQGLATGANQPFAAIQCGTKTVIPPAPAPASGG